MFLTRPQLMDAYMAFGGIPFYLNLLNPRWSLALNIEELCFRQNGQFRYESERMLASLFRNPEIHNVIIHMLAEKRNGMTRKKLTAVSRLSNNEKPATSLAEL